jgi:trimeric autotransporter adhesin
LSTSFWSATLAPPFDGRNNGNNFKYTPVVGFTGQTPNMSVDIGVVGNSSALLYPFDPVNDWVEITTSYQTLMTVQVRIVAAQNTGVAGVDFDETLMNGQSSKIIDVNTLLGYTNPNLYDAANFLDTYVGRIYSNALGWSQVGNSSPAQWVNWSTAVNTSIYDGTAAAIPTTGTSLAGAVRIHSGATLTIPPAGKLTAASIENNTANGLVIQSDVTNTGSLIAGSATGSTVVQRYMPASSWRIATSPVAGQIVGGFLNANSTVATNGSLRGMTDYAIATDTWNPFFTNSEGSGINVGKGYMLRAASTGAGSVSFTGTLNTAITLVGVAPTGNGWNCVGNPFSSAITKDALLNNNTAVFPTGYKSLYVYNGTSYDIINLVQGQTTIQSGQGFFVKAGSATDLSFATGLQVHDNGAVLKSVNTYPEIKLTATNDSKSASTLIKFVTGTTKGLDEGYDAGIFKSDIGLNIYTKLVEDNGIDFGLQCLPNNDFSSMIIPVGIDSKVGGEVVFSSELVNLPSDCKVILEDKLSKTFTDLSKNVYKTSIAANSTIVDRFQIHTSYQTTGLGGDYFTGKLSAYAIRNFEIRLKGDVSKQAIATLYDVQGRVILTRTLEGGSLNVIRTPYVKTGIYMLFVKDGEKIQGFKLPMNE